MAQVLYNCAIFGSIIYMKLEIAASKCKQDDVKVRFLLYYILLIISDQNIINESKQYYILYCI